MATRSEQRVRHGFFARLVTAPVDIASLAAFRVGFGLLMAGAMARFLAKGWVRELYVEPTFHFTYPGFGWVRPWPDVWMHAHFAVLGLLALGVAFGFYYRLCMAFFFLGFTYVELLDQTAYLNHYYFISLVSGLMIFQPAHRAWSVDARRDSSLRVDAVPAWTLNLLRFQVVVVYVFAGLAKLNADWLLRAQPLRIWLAARSDLPGLGPWLDEAWVAFLASWFGAAFDITIVFFLLCRRTRRVAYGFVILFHVATWLLFNIGMFPWIMILSATLMFSPDWPRYWLARMALWFARVSRMGSWAGRLRDAIGTGQPPRVLAVRPTPLLLAALGGYAVVQLALPLRPYFMAQPSAWTCAAFNCAWRVMLVEKTGYVKFYACDPSTGTQRRVSVHNYLTPRQEVMMAQDPYLIRALARRMAADLESPNSPDLAIRIQAFATLNGRPAQRLIDPEVDLARASGTGWILPFEDQPSYEQPLVSRDMRHSTVHNRDEQADRGGL